MVEKNIGKGKIVVAKGSWNKGLQKRWMMLVQHPGSGGLYA